MNTLTQLFDWLLTASLRASLLSLATLLLQAALHRNLSARMRYALWLPVLVVLLMPVLPQSRWSIEYVFQAPPQTMQIMPEVTVSPGMEQATVASNAPGPMPAPIDWQHMVVLVWLSGAAGMLILGSISFTVTLRRFRHTCHPTSEELQAALAQIAHEIRLRHVPRVLVAPSVSSPAVTGLLRPTLLLPAHFDREFTPSESRLVLKHELMHLKRGDLPLNALMCLLMALHWFNPLLWIAFFKIRADREAACDAQVLHDASKDHRAEYGHALLKVEAAFCSRGLSLGFVGIFQRGAMLRHRIHSIAIQSQPRASMKLLTLASIALMTFLGITRAAPETNDAPLIYIEARFIEVPLPTDQPAEVDKLLTEMLDSSVGIPGKEGPVKMVMDDAQYHPFVRKLSHRKGVDLLATPTVATHSGQRATLEITREFAFPQEKKTSGLKVGVMMDVQPILTDKNTLDLKVTPKAVEFEGFTKAGSGEQKPIFSERKAEAHTSMKPGQTVLLDLGSKTDIQAIEDHVDGKVIHSTRHLVRHLFVLVTARLDNAEAGTAFTPAKSAFRPGDSIQITQLQRYKDFITVTADYELASVASAKIALFITSKDKEKTKVDPAQFKLISKGKGRVVLRHPAMYEGMPHVSFYDTETGEAIGGIYFGTDAEAAESRTLNLDYMTAPAQTKAEAPATNKETKIGKSIIPETHPDDPTDVAAEHRRARPQEYNFAKAPLGDVLRSLATDAGMNFIALPDDNPINQRLITFSIQASPFDVLETMCRANGLALVLDHERWLIRPSDDSALIEKDYVLPQTQASIEIILKDIGMLLEGDKSKPKTDAAKSSVTYNHEQKAFSVKATAVQHSWISGYFRGLTGAAQHPSTK